MNDASTVKTLALPTQRPEVPATLARLRSQDLLETALASVDEGGLVHLPVKRAVEGAVEVETHVRGSSAPLARALWWLRRRGLSEDVLSKVPRKWDRVGDVLLVKDLDAVAPHERLVAEALAWADGARSVLEDGGIAGPARKPRGRFLWGDPVTVTHHREHGLTYVVDPARVMWASGNNEERPRLAVMADPDEHIVDLTACVGYFTLPLAAHGCTVHAIERNPVSAQLLRAGVAANGLGDQVTVHVGDARRIAPEGVADRVLVGCFPGASVFLDAALASLREGRGWVHVHDVAPAHAPHLVWERVRARLRQRRRSARLAQLHVVKGYAPGRVHVVADVEVGS